MCSITLNPDGTGEVLPPTPRDFFPSFSASNYLLTQLRCGYEAHVTILSEIECKPLGDSSAALHQPVDLDTDFQASVDIHLTITRGLAPLARVLPSDMDEPNLKDAALEPKTYTVQVSKWTFTPDDFVYLYKDNTEGETRNTDITDDLQLLFNPSPFSPLNKWVEGTIAHKLAKLQDI